MLVVVLVLVVVVVFTVLPRESSGHELPGRWLEQHCQPASPARTAADLPAACRLAARGRATPCNTALSTMHTVYNNAIAARYSCHTGKSPHSKRLFWMFLTI